MSSITNRGGLVAAPFYPAAPLSLLPKTGGFASPPYGGFALRIRNDTCVSSPSRWGAVNSLERCRTIRLTRLFLLGIRRTSHAASRQAPERLVRRRMSVVSLR